MKKLLLFLVVGVVLVVGQANAAPPLVNYQGVLTDAAGVAISNPVQAMTFRLYDAEAGGNLLWEEPRSVEVQNGSYSLLLGAVTPLDSSLLAGDDVWLEVEVDGETLAQRQRLVSVPFALQAGSLTPGIVPCNPGDYINCYTGSSGTMGVGVCSGGIRTCGPQGLWGSCAGERLPGTEVCDALDNDCNGIVDDAAGAPLWYKDADSDGFGDPATATPFCDVPPAGYVDNTLDCNDASAASSPLLREVCGDGIDNDCDTLIDPPGCLAPGSCPAGALRVIQQLAMTSCFAECAFNPGAPACVDCLMVNSGYDGICIYDALAAVMCIMNAGCAPDLAVIDYQCVSSVCINQYQTAFGPPPRDCVPGTTRGCGTDIGACQSGTEACVDGSWSGTCEGSVAPVAEICSDGIDNDCNGLVDDRCTPPVAEFAEYDPFDNVVRIYFDLPLDPTSVQADASQVSFSGGLVALNALVLDNLIQVAVANPQHNFSYEVSVVGTVTSVAGIGIDTGTFPIPFQVWLSDGTPCEDGDPCTLDDMVQGPGCLGTPLDCSNLDNGCSLGQCDPGTGSCVSVPATAGTPCDDGDICTENEVCDGAGVCAAGVPVSCDDGDVCTVNSCDPQAGCSSTPVVCDDGVLCTFDVCDPVFGCQAIPDDAACDDGDPLTADSCDPLNGCQMVPVPDGTPCNDGLSCTQNDHVEGGLCVGEPLSCDDGNPWTVDSCDEINGCTSYPLPDGTPCDDGDPCTVGDHVQGGTCVAVPKSCNDGLACTQDSCNPADGSCSNTIVQDSCLIGGSCYQLTDPNPLNSCQSCNPFAAQTSWTNVPSGYFCDDGDVCNGQDICNGAGACSPGAPVDCDDSNECTADACDSVVGCQHAALPDGTGCSLGICQSGVCQ